jgi:hypothetical protein
MRPCQTAVILLALCCAIPSSADTLSPHEMVSGALNDIQIANAQKDEALLQSRVSSLSYRLFQATQIPSSANAGKISKVIAWERVADELKRAKQIVDSQVRIIDNEYAIVVLGWDEVLGLSLCLFSQVTPRVQMVNAHRIAKPDIDTVLDLGDKTQEVYFNCARNIDEDLIKGAFMTYEAVESVPEKRTQAEIDARIERMKPANEAKALVYNLLETCIRRARGHQ